MLASVDGNEGPAVHVNVGDPAGVTVPTCPVVDGRGQAEHPGLVIALVQELVHVPDCDSTILDVCNESSPVKGQWHVL